MNFNHDTGSIDTILSLDTTIAPPLGGTTNSLVVVGTGALYVPVGVSADRGPTTSGGIRFNTEIGALEYSTGATWVTVSSGGGTVQSVAVEGSPGLAVAGSPITTTGTITLTLDGGLQSLATLATTGIIVQSAADTYISRAIAGTASNIVVTNDDGVAGNPTINLATVTQGAGTNFVKINIDGFGRVTGNSPVVAGDITALVDGTYVNVSGDTMQSGANLTFAGGGTVTGLPMPVNPTDAASKAYVDMSIQGADPKASVRAASTAPASLASFTNGATVDGVTLTTGDRFLNKNASNAAENGIYVITAGAPTRAADMDTWLEVPGAFVWVEQGTINGDTGWVCTSDQGGTIDTTPITFVQFGGIGSYTAGNGLTLTGTQFSLTTPVTVANGGTGTSTLPANGQLLIGNGTGYAVANLTQGTGVTITNGAGSITIANAGVTSVAGTANQITASASTGDVTLSLPSAVTFPGSITTTTSATIGTSLTVSGLTSNSFIYSGTAGQITSTAAPTNGQILIGSTGAAPVATTITQGTGIAVTNGAGSITIANAGVTSFSAGTTGLTPNTPTTGAITLGGTLGVTNGGTGNNVAPTDGQLLIGNGTTYVRSTLTAGTGINIVNGAGTITVENAGVTSFTQTVPSFLQQAGATAATGAVSSTITLASQTANTVFAAPNGAAGAPTFRSLVFADLGTSIQLYRENPSTPTTPVATGANAVAVGSDSSATATDSIAFNTGAVASLFGAKAFANGRFATNGDAQKMLLIARGSTTNATVTEIFLDGAAQRMVLPNNSLWTFSIFVAARRTDATGGGAGYRIDGVIRRDGTAASTTLTGAVSKSILGETNTAWDVTVDADTTNGSLRIRVTGEAAKTIRWVASAEIVQVTN